MKVFYHNDMDGIISARIILEEMRKRNISFTEQDFVEMDYAKIFPIKSHTYG